MSQPDNSANVSVRVRKKVKIVYKKQIKIRLLIDENVRMYAWCDQTLMCTSDFTYRFLLISYQLWWARYSDQ